MKQVGLESMELVGFDTMELVGFDTMELVGFESTAFSDLTRSSLQQRICLVINLPNLKNWLHL